jgi:hypothetical protein
MGNQIQSVGLENYLNSAASDQNYIQNIQSYLYNSQAVTSAPDKVKFIIQTVDGNGRPFKYVVNGYNIVGIKLTINPSSVSVNLAKMINRTQTMSSWVEDHWGEELDTITFQGSSAGFIWEGPTPYIKTPQGVTQTAQEVRTIFNQYNDIADLGSTEPHGVGDNSGLTVKRRRDTVSYNEFRQLMQLMNANGASFDTRGLVSDRLFIQLSYDYASYLGYFESFDLTESADTPFRFIYTITFKAEKTVYSFLS